MQAPPIQWLLEGVASRAHDTAIRFADSHWSYERLADEVLRTAAVLADYEFEPKSRIGLIFGAGPAFVTTLLGSLAAGLTAVPLSPMFMPREYASHIRRNALAAVVTDPTNARNCHIAMVEAGVSGQVLTIGESRFGQDIASEIAAAAPGTPVLVSPDEPAVVLHTSGSTGRPKLVPRTHREVAAECDSVAASVCMTPEDVLFGILPLHHCHGLFNTLFASLRAQCALSLFLDTRPFVLARDDVLATMVRDRVSIVPSIPFQLESLARGQQRYDLSAVRLCYTGGAALKTDTWHGFKNRFGVLIRQQYGCTEAGAVTLNLDDNIDASFATVGKALAGVSVSVIDADASGAGEIFIRSEALTAGYEGMEEINSQVFVDGGFRTGDFGRIDPDGNLVVTSRRPIYVDVAGHKVDASEVEDVLEELPGVREARVMAVGSNPAAMKAVIVADLPLDTRKVREFCRERLASFKVPSIFEYAEPSAFDKGNLHITGSAS